MNFKHIVGLKLKRIFVLLVSATTFFIVVYVVYHSNHKHELPGNIENNVVYRKSKTFESKTWQNDNNNVGIIPEKYNEHDVRMRIIQEKVKRLTSTSNENRNHKKTAASHLGDKTKEKDMGETDAEKHFVRHVQIFYYAPVPWYKPSVKHLNFNRMYDNNTILYKNDELLNIAFYPERGLYDASGKKIFHEHFQEIRNIGVGVIILAWTTLMPKHLLSTIFMIALKYDLRVAIQIESYNDRTAESVRNDIKFVIDNYGNHMGLEKMFILEKQKYLPIFYVKDAYLIADADWRKITSKTGTMSLRDTYYDALLIAQITIQDHKAFVRRASFDGFYTYLPSNGATYATTWKNWDTLRKFADLYKLLFIPTIGPGFYDKKKQPKHGSIRRYRSNGQYYGVAWRTAISIDSPIITISSFNNWAEGTQIEPAVPMSGYRDYQPGTSSKYLDLTKHWLNEFCRLKLSHTPLTCNRLLNNTIC